MSHEGRRFRMRDVFVVLFCLVVGSGLLLTGCGRARDEARGNRCASNLSQIGKGMAMYLNIHGRNSTYSIPAQAFRGDAWLASLYWSGIIMEPRVFVCPATDDDYTKIPPTQAAAGDLNSADAIPADAMSYAGRCKGTTFTHRNTSDFTESNLTSASALACDDSEGGANHQDGINVVYFDAHVDFMVDVDLATIGAPGSEYQHLDSGE
jgi:prepilin-type processing-associated H-X9-DG protein